MAKKQKKKVKKKKYKFPDNDGKCINCNQNIRGKEGHFCPPFGGDPGFFICTPNRGDNDKS
jgi:hypothetical protein